MRKGDTVLWAPQWGCDHLWIALTEPDENSKLVIANITGSKGGTHAVVLKLSDGCHPFIYKDSDVNYGDAMVADVLAITNAISSGKASLKGAMKMSCVERIARGGKSHPAVTRDIQNRLAREWP